MGSQSVTPPIILDGDGGPYLFASLADAQSWMEAIDLRNGEYVGCYDSKGRRVDIRLERTPRLLFGRFHVGDEDLVILECAEESPSHSAQLRSLLSKSLQRMGVTNDWLQNATLEDLVNECARRFA